MQRIRTEAYQALRQALPAITWNKRPFESYLRTALRGHPELLAGLNFTDTKRSVADALVDRLVQGEMRYQQATIDLMLEVASMTTFSNIEAIADPADRTLRLEQARRAVADLAKLVEPYSQARSERERVEAELASTKALNEATQRFMQEIDALKDRFLALSSSTDVHDRGRQLERLLTELFCLFDMEPRLAYSLPNEQIDGSLTFDTDDYIVEARWRQAPVSRGDADVFAAKVRRKGKTCQRDRRLLPRAEPRLTVWCHTLSATTSTHRYYDNTATATSAKHYARTRSPAKCLTQRRRQCQLPPRPHRHGISSSTW